MRYRVRVAQLADMPQLVALRVQSNQKKIQGNTERRTESRDENKWLRFAMLTLVCEEEGMVKGFIAVTIFPPLPLAGLVAPLWEIIEFCVAEANTEVASALLQEIGHRATEAKGNVVAIW